MKKLFNKNILKLKRDLHEVILDLRKERNSKFLFLSYKTNVLDLAKILVYEISKNFSQSDNLMIDLVLKNLIQKKILHPQCVEYKNYTLGEIIYHDVFLKTIDNRVFCRGTSTDFTEAFAKAFGEVFERTTIKYPSADEFIFKKVGDIKKDKNFIDFNIFAKPTEKQLEKFPDFIIYDHDIFGFTKVKRISDDSDIFAPTQLFFYGNFSKDSEKKIIQPTTTSAGAGYTRWDAFRSAIFETTHRHFFFNSWYKKLSPKKIDLNSIPKTEKLFTKIQNFKKHDFNIHLLDFSEQAQVPTNICLIEIYGGWYCGGSTSLTSIGAIERSLDEAFATYLWSAGINLEGRNFFEKEFLNTLTKSEDFVDEKTSAFNRVMAFGNSYFLNNFDKFFINGEVINYTNSFDKDETFDLKNFAIKTYGPNVFEYQKENEYLKEFNYSTSKVFVPNSYYFALNEIYSRPVLFDQLEPTFTKISPFP